MINVVTKQKEVIIYWYIQQRYLSGKDDWALLVMHAAKEQNYL